MTNVSIIGTGTMAHAISGVLTAGGATVELIGHGQPATPTGDVVVLAVPYPAVPDVIAPHGAALAGKIVVDITNPLDFATFDALVVPADGSATAEIAAALPQSRVLKAFNTTFAATLAAEPVEARLKDARRQGRFDPKNLASGDVDEIWRVALHAGVIDEREFALVERRNALRNKVIRVNEFP